VRIELKGVLDHRPVLGVFLVAQHVHESRVVDAVHAQGPYKVALHKPEGLGEEQRTGDLGSYAVDHLAPELVRHLAVNLRSGHAVLGARGDGAAGARTGKPEPVEVALGQGHGGVKADDGKKPRHVQDGLDHLLTYRGVEVIELGGIVPGKAGAVVSVIDVAGFAGPQIATAEDDGRVGLLEVVVFDFDLDPPVVRKVWSVEAVGRVGRFGAGDKPLRVLDDPGRIDTHVVGDHVACQSDTEAGGAVAEVDKGRLAAKVLGDVVIEK